MKSGSSRLDFILWSRDSTHWKELAICNFPCRVTDAIWSTVRPWLPTPFHNRRRYKCTLTVGLRTVTYVQRALFSQLTAAFGIWLKSGPPTFYSRVVEWDVFQVETQVNAHQSYDLMIAEGMLFHPPVWNWLNEIPDQWHRNIPADEIKKHTFDNHQVLWFRVVQCQNQYSALESDGLLKQNPQKCLEEFEGRQVCAFVLLCFWKIEWREK